MDYLSIYENSGVIFDNTGAFLSLFILFLARILPIISLSPFFGARVLPHPVKVAFAISLFAIFFPMLLVVVKTPLAFNFSLIFLTLKEVFIGFSIGFIMSTPFTIVSNVGIIIDHQRGGASLMVNDPTIQNQSSPLGTLFNMILIFTFFFVDGPYYFLDAIMNSYEILPPDRLLNEHFFNKEIPFWDIQLSLLNKVMTITMKLGAPALIAILMTDLFLGIANRLAPQVQITFLGMPLKSILALLVVCLGWKIYTEQTVDEIFIWLEYLKRSIQSFKI